MNIENDCVRVIEETEKIDDGAKNNLREQINEEFGNYYNKKVKNQKTENLFLSKNGSNGEKQSGGVGPTGEAPTTFRRASGRKEAETIDSNDNNRRRRQTKKKTQKEEPDAELKLTERNLECMHIRSRKHFSPFS